MLGVRSVYQLRVTFSAFCSVSLEMGSAIWKRGLGYGCSHVHGEQFGRIIFCREQHCSWGSVVGRSMAASPLESLVWLHCSEVFVLLRGRFQGKLWAGSRACLHCRMQRGLSLSPCTSACGHLPLLTAYCFQALFEQWVLLHVMLCPTIWHGGWRAGEILQCLKGSG